MNETSTEITLVSITLLLFMLSVITEKITNFIKLYVPALAIKKENDVKREKKTGTTNTICICHHWHCSGHYLQSRFF